MTAPIRITGHRPRLWDFSCFPCGLGVWTTSHAEALSYALAHLAARHPRPLPSGMADPEPGCTCDPYGAATCNDHRSNKMTRTISRAQMGRLHATGAEHGLSHDDLRARAAHLLGWGDDPDAWPSLSTLTTTQASWVTDHLVDRPRETRPDEISGRYQVVIRLGKSFEWQGRQVDRIEWSATIGEYDTVIHCYADSTDRPLPPVPHDQIPAEWPRPPEGLVVWP